MSSLKMGKIIIIWIICATGISLSLAQTNTTTSTMKPSTTTSLAPETEVTPPPKKKTARQRLRDFLLRDHDPGVNPVEDSDKPLVTEIGMAIIHLDLDEMKSALTVDAWMRISWTDDHLKWNPDDFDGVKDIHFGDKEIWKPDVHLYNSAQEASIYPFGSIHFVVSSDGQVLWVPPAHFKAFCKINLRFWPFDEQICTLKFGSWTAHGHQIDLKLYNNHTTAEVMNIYTENREWKIIGDIKATLSKVRYDCCSEPYPDVTFTVKLARNAPAYRSVIILPCLVIMLVTGSSFLLTPQSGEKLILNGFALISSLLYLIYFATTLPFHSTEVPIIVSFYSNTAALIGIAIMLNVVCISMARERKYSSPPKFLKNFFSGVGGRLLCLGNYTHQVSSTHQRLVVELDDLPDNENQTQHETHTGNGDVFRPENRIRNSFEETENSLIMRDWIMVAAGIERLFFIIYALAFAIITSVYV